MKDGMRILRVYEAQTPREAKGKSREFGAEMETALRTTFPQRWGVSRGLETESAGQTLRDILR
jgi:hypothetical protein